ncbi:MAG: isoaspartyl peptidase/L-asparaginase [Anaerolineae bacterium]
MGVALIVHGGAWDIPEDLQEPHVAGCLRAAREGWRVLREGGTALEAVEAAIVCMEDDPVFDAGRGSCLNAAGEVELDAGLMRGTDLRVGAVAAVQGIANPIRLARLVLEQSEHILLVGQGAVQFAQEKGVPLVPPERLIVERERARWERLRQQPAFQVRDAFGRADTVGAVALDVQGHLAAGTSTGGTPFKHPGRVGDVPQVGCGFYADDGIGGVSCTGWGESIAKVVLAKTALDLLGQTADPILAARLAIQILAAKVGGLGGLILLDARGRPGWAHNTPHMAMAYQVEGMEEPVGQIR